jgi:hypothetical protein
MSPPPCRTTGNGRPRVFPAEQGARTSRPTPRQMLRLRRDDLLLGQERLHVVGRDRMLRNRGTALVQYSAPAVVAQDEQDRRCQQGTKACHGITLRRRQSFMSSGSADCHHVAGNPTRTNRVNQVSECEHRSTLQLSSLSAPSALSHEVEARTVASPLFLRGSP